MDAARLKRARRRLRGYFFGSGVVMAALYLIAAAFVVRLVGVELTHYWATLMLAAGVMLGGTYAIVILISLVVHLARRWAGGKPLMEIEN